MKRVFLIFILCFSFLLWGAIAFAIPVDLSTFTAEPNDPTMVNIDTNTITFYENFDHFDIYAANYSFWVPDNTTILSFDYEIILGEEEYDDYLTFEAYDELWNGITYNEFPIYLSPEHLSGGPFSGHFEIDLFNFRTTEISLAWGFHEGDLDGSADSTARVFNIDLAESATPVPEPATLILMGTGLAGLFGIRRKKFLHDLS